MGDVQKGVSEELLNWEGFRCSAFDFAETSGGTCGEALYAAGTNGCLVLVDPREKRGRGEEHVVHDKKINTVSVDPGGSGLLATSSQGEVCVWTCVGCLERRSGRWRTRARARRPTSPRTGRSGCSRRVTTTACVSSAARALSPRCASGTTTRRGGGFSLSGPSGPQTQRASLWARSAARWRYSAALRKTPSTGTAASCRRRCRPGTRSTSARARLLPRLPRAACTSTGLRGSDWCNYIGGWSIQRSILFNSCPF